MKALNRLAMLFVCGVLAISLAACGGDSTSSDAPSNESAEASTEAESAPESDYVVTIDGARVTTDYNGDPCVVISFTFTNNSEETTSMASAVYPRVFQNGIECEMAFGTDYDSGGYSADLRPGASIQTELAYELTDMSEIEVEVSDLFSWDDTVLAYQVFTLE